MTDSTQGDSTSPEDSPSNVSGGVNASTEGGSLNVGGDVTGRDKNISAGTYIGHVEVHYHGSAAVDKAPIPLPRTQVAKLFISYKRNADPDQQLAITLYEVLTRGGHQVFMDTTMRTGDAWLEEIDRQLKASDFDYIIFDMPNVSQTSVTPRLASFMDMVLLVAEAERTDAGVLQQAAKALTDTGANVATVLNRVRSHVPQRFSHELT